MDNYNAKWRMKMHNINKDNFVMANWTGIAVREYTGPELDMTIRRKEGICIPAQADDIFKHIPAVKNLILQNTEVSNSNFTEKRRIIAGMVNFPFLYDSSLLHVWGVDRLPLKPQAGNVNIPPKYNDAIIQAPDTLANFYPKGVFPHNIGSNEGFIAMLKKYFDEFIKENQTEKYHVITVDENIYKRAMRVNFFFCTSIFIQYCTKTECHAHDL